MSTATSMTTWVWSPYN